jgi:hypothetical protein
MHHTFHHITMVMGAVVEQNGAVTIGPMVTEITL